MPTTLRMLFVGTCVAGAMVVFTPTSKAGAVHECVSASPTAESETWDFKAETNMIFQEIRADAVQALDHADQLQSFTRDPGMRRESHAAQLDALKDEVNDIGAKLCRLETSQRVVEPWQQKEIEQIAVAVRLMADNTQDAILFTGAHSNELWTPTDQKYTNNLYDEARSLTNSINNAVSFANVSKQYRSLSHEFGM